MSSGSGSHNTQSENSNATSSGENSLEGTPEGTSTTDNSLGSVVTDGDQTVESGTIGSVPEEQSEISSSTEQTGNTETNQSSTFIQSEAGTGKVMIPLKMVLRITLYHWLLRTSLASLHQDQDQNLRLPLRLL